ncbi:MAG TPA: response regulator transcription factor [Acidimicrobiales bacterium]|nr:response regulator transcription factor [Acidimicrobiales bacterium]
MVVAAEDQGTRSVLRHMLEADGRTIVEEAGSEEELVDALEATPPDVAIIHLPFRPADALARTRRVHSRHPGVPLVAFSASSDRATVLAAIDAGARGYLLADDDAQQIVAAVHTAAQGASPLSPRAATALVSERSTATAEQLTRRERDVLSLLGEGISNKEIARRLGISERTVKAHLTSAFRRIGVRGRTQAALWVPDHQGPPIDVRDRPRELNFDQGHMT